MQKDGGLCIRIETGGRWWIVTSVGWCFLSTLLFDVSNITLWCVLFRVISINQNVWNIYHKHYRYDAFLVMDNFMTLKANMLRKLLFTYITNVIFPSGVYCFVWIQATRMFEIFTTSITGMMPFFLWIIPWLPKLICFVNDFSHISQM